MLSAIVQKLTGKTLLEYLRPRLFEPLGIENPVWETSRAVSTPGDGASSSRRRTSPASGRCTCRRASGRGSALCRRRGWRSPRPTFRQQQQRDDRLEAGLRVPVLALPARCLPGRRRVRPVLHRDAGPGRGVRRNGRRGEHAVGAGPGLEASAAGDGGGALARGSERGRRAGAALAGAGVAAGCGPGPAVAGGRVVGTAVFV